MMCPESIIIEGYKYLMLYNNINVNSTTPLDLERMDNFSILVGTYNNDNNYTLCGSRMFIVSF